MKIEKQVCTKKQGEMLQSFGIDLSIFRYHIDRIITADEAWANSSIPAFTVAELGEMLMASDKAETTKWDSDRHTWSIEGALQPQEYDTEAECRADCVIFLLKNGYTTAEKINNRLYA